MARHNLTPPGSSRRPPNCSPRGCFAANGRPVLRSYSVRAYRPDGPDGPELDIDFVLHGSAADGTAGPAATWAQHCARDDAVAILDEGSAAA